ncbi:MAG: iron ABC transporter permease, partial [Pseudomonadota bacterium]
KRIGFNPATVILSGIAISTILAAVVAWLYLIMPPTQLQNLTFWLMGSLSNANWFSIVVAFVLVLVCSLVVFKNNQRLNWLFFGGQVAAIKGLDTYRFQRSLLVLIAVMVGTSVSIAGSIAFIGLIIPHMLRRLHGHDNSIIVPLSGICGAGVLTLCALINEHVATSPLPVSLLTASIGAPIFIWLLLKGSAMRSLRHTA